MPLLPPKKPIRARSLPLFIKKELENLDLFALGVNPGVGGDWAESLLL
jgi:hypothetical protein